MKTRAIRILDSMTDEELAAKAPEAAARLCRKAFDLYGAMALWNVRKDAQPSNGLALAISDALRNEGDLAARALAETIENIVHVPHRFTDPIADAYRRQSRS